MSIIKKYVIIFLLLQFTFTNTFASMKVKVCQKSLCSTEKNCKSELESFNEKYDCCNLNIEKFNYLIDNSSISNNDNILPGCCINNNSFNQQKENCCKINNLTLKFTFISNANIVFNHSPKLVVNIDYRFKFPNIILEDKVKSISFNSKPHLKTSKINQEIISFQV